MPTTVSTPASAINNPRTVRGRAPTERRMAISRRRSLSVVKIMVTMPSRAVATTIAETAFKAVSAVPTSPHSSCSAAPGRIAESVRHEDGVTDLVAERRGDIGADYRIEQIGKRCTRGEGEAVGLAISVMLEIVGCGAEHAKAAVTVAERERHDPVDLGARGDV